METKVFILGSYYLEKDIEMVMRKYYKNNISVSNEQYEKKLLKGFFDIGSDVSFISSPRVGYWPFSAKSFYVKSFSENNYLHTNCYFNFFGLSNFSKKIHLKRACKKLLKRFLNSNYDIRLIVCEAHEPYLSTVRYFKKKYKNIFTTLIVPDLPIDMKKSNNFIYKILKRHDVKKINKLSKIHIDSFVCFTKEINDYFNKKCFKPYCISNGLILKHTEQIKTRKETIICTYIGKTDQRNGIDIIISLAKMNIPHVEFHIYGSGEYDNVLRSFKFHNLYYHGFIQPIEIPNIMEKTDVFLSPRYPNENYCKYSFPSKILEALSFYKPIITFRLPCFSSIFDDVLIYPKECNFESFYHTFLDWIHNNPKINIDNYNKIIDSFSPITLSNKIMEFKNE